MIIKGGIIACDDNEPIEDGIIEISNGIISNIGWENEVDPSSDAIIDASGMTIIPGLIDCHVHFCRGYGYEPLDSNQIAESTLYGVEHARRYINAGITTVRDLGCKHHGIFALRREIEVGRLLGPRMIISGRIIYPSGMKSGLGVNADGSSDVRKTAREELGAGADWVKVYVSGRGTGSRPRDPWDTWMTADEISSACEEAHTKGMRAAAHAINAESAMNCIEGGIDSIEHGLLLNDKSLNEMKRNNIFYVPTVYTFYRNATLGVKLGLIKQEDAWIEDRLKNELLPSHRQNVRKASEMGVKIAAGTDIPNPKGDTDLIRSDSLARELRMMVDYGLSPMHALITATKSAAEMLGLLDKVGTLEKGKIADLLILNNDPLEDIQALLPKNVLLVMKEGKIIKNILPNR